MKISVCGKGGSGKSTITSLLSQAARARGYRVLVVDADESNSGLHLMLGFERPPLPLMDLVGGKKGLKQRLSQPTVLSENRLTTAQIPEEHILHRDGLMLVSIGKILASLEGCACPMGVLGREFLNKLVLQPDEIAIVDMEAGVEHFGRGVETSVDSVLIVVEPPLESVSVAQKIRELAVAIGIRNVWAIMNKIPSAEIAARLEDQLRQRHIEAVGCVYLDSDVFTSSLDGGVPTAGVAVREMGDILERILARAGIAPTAQPGLNK